jgi:hypothetical protein
MEHVVAEVADSIGDVDIAVIAQGLLNENVDYYATPSDLYTVDPDNNYAFTSVGPIGYVVVSLGYDATTDTLYGATSTDVAESNLSTDQYLITIDRTTGGGTIVGELGSGRVISDLAVGADGTIYGIADSSTDPGNEYNGTIYTIDKGTGTASILITYPDIDYGQPDPAALAFDADGVLWGFGYSYVLTHDPDTGAAVEVDDSFRNEYVQAATTGPDGTMIVMDFDSTQGGPGIRAVDFSVTPPVLALPAYLPSVGGTPLDDYDSVALEWVITAGGCDELTPAAKTCDELTPSGKTCATATPAAGVCDTVEAAAMTCD